MENENMLKTISDRLSTWMEIVAGTALIGVMLLIGSDIVEEFSATRFRALMKWSRWREG